MGPITFSGATLDRVAERRARPEWVQAARQDPRARAIIVSRHGVGLEGEPPTPGDDAWAGGQGDQLTPTQIPLDDREAILLGLVDGDVPLWVVEAEEDAPGLTDLRQAAPVLSDPDAGLFAYAQQLVHWRRTHRFCGTCGEPTEARDAGHQRVCPNGHTIHPRTDPVVIMLVIDGADRVLMGRQPTWPAGRYSALAGFVDPGESLEDAVAREVKEESGIEVADVRYLTSQPWPFPANLMLGFFASYAGGDAVADEDELEDVRWFTRAEVLAAGREEGDFKLPPEMAIARRLIDTWLADGPPQNR